MPASCLSLHADFACRRSGACCTAGWPIHVERDRLTAWREALAGGQLTFVPDETGGITPFEDARDLPPDAGASLRTRGSGACVFHRGDGLCDVQRAMGHASLPVACQHFPRRCLIEPGRVAVSLSHFCPTVARLAFRTDVSPAIVAAPPALVGHLALEGLDAREALPPLLRPGLLADRDTYHAWEATTVGVLSLDIAPESALARISALAEGLRSWTPGDGSLRERLDALVSTLLPDLGVGAVFRDDRTVFQNCQPEKPLRPLPHLEGYEMARAAVPAGIPTDPPPEGLADLDAGLVAPAWRRFARPLRQFLAAHAFGNWCAYNGQGVRSVVRSLEVALGVVRVEAARACARGMRPLGETQLVEAFRAADLLLVHLADPTALADRLSAVERG